MQLPYLYYFLSIAMSDMYMKSVTAVEKLCVIMTFIDEILSKYLLPTR